ncbi:MAG TPA: hypothetical protein VGJ15_00290 [Pirellulales bacterium]|jgi:hypothetical protein
MAVGPHSEPHDRLKLPQFTLRTMFLVIAALGVLFAVMTVIGPWASVGLLFALAMVGLHVAGNAIGTTLRDNNSPANIQFREPPRIDSEAVPVRHKTAPPRLCEHKRLSWLNCITTVLGAVAGGYAGAIVLGVWASTPLRGLVLGCASSALLGGFLGFMAGSIVEIALAVWWQATSPPRTIETAPATDFANHTDSSAKHTIPTAAPPFAPFEIPPALIADMDAG